MQANIRSYAKINLALNVIKKISNFHKIESIVSFISLHDEILIKKINSKNHIISFTGKFSKNIGKINTVSKLLNILDNKKLLKNNKTNHTTCGTMAIKKEYFENKINLYFLSLL